MQKEAAHDRLGRESGKCANLLVVTNPTTRSKQQKAQNYLWKMAFLKVQPEALNQI